MIEKKDMPPAVIAEGLPTDFAHDPDKIRKWVQEKLSAGLPMAIRTLLELAETADSESTRLQAAKDVMGLLGVTAKQEIKVDALVQHQAVEVDEALQEWMGRLARSREGGVLEGVPSLAIEAGAIEAAPIAAPIEAAIEAHAVEKPREGGHTRECWVQSGPCTCGAD